MFPKYTIMVIFLIYNHGDILITTVKANYSQDSTNSYWFKKQGWLHDIFTVKQAHCHLFEKPKSWQK